MSREALDPAQHGRPGQAVLTGTVHNLAVEGPMIPHVILIDEDRGPDGRPLDPHGPTPNPAVVEAISGTSAVTASLIAWVEHPTTPRHWQSCALHHKASPSSGGAPANYWPGQRPLQPFRGVRILGGSATLSTRLIDAQHDVNTFAIVALPRCPAFCSPTERRIDRQRLTPVPAHPRIDGGTR